MKKIYGIFAFAAMLTAALSSCSREVIEPEDDKDKEETAGPDKPEPDVPDGPAKSVTVHFVANSSVETKVMLSSDDEKTFYSSWENGDKIRVDYTNGNGDSGSASAGWNGESFTAELPAYTGEWNYKAIYPVPAESNTVDLGSLRTQKGNVYNGSYDIMTGSAAAGNAEAGKDNNGDNIVFNMKRQTAVAYFHFTSELTDAVTKATLTVNGGAIASRSATASTETGLVADADLRSITVVFPDEAPSADDFKLWFNILETDYESVTLTIETAGDIFTVTNDTPGSYVAGNLYKVSKTLEKNVANNLKNHLKTDFSWWDNLAPRLSHGTDKTFLRGFKCLKLCSDDTYIYGYVEVDTEKVFPRNSTTPMPSMLNNLGIWIDNDDVSTGQGGGWIFNLAKRFNVLMRGKCSNSGEPVEWEAARYDVSGGGDNFGQAVESTEDAAAGAGELDGTVFRYTFVLDRARLGLDAKTETHVGVSFDAGYYNDNVIAPDRSGYPLKLGTSPDLEYDLGETELPLKADPAFWAAVGEADLGTDTQFSRGTQCAKFSVDENYIYGYVQVDTAACPSYNGSKYLNYLGVWLDTDDVHSGQGGGWALSKSPKGYDILLYGQCSDNASPVPWSPAVRDCSKKADSFGTAHAGAADYYNVAAGNGWVSDGMFNYTFTLSRAGLGLKDIEELPLAVTFNHTNLAYNNYFVVPARCGFTLNLAE